MLMNPFFGANPLVSRRKSRRIFLTVTFGQDLLTHCTMLGNIKVISIIVSKFWGVPRDDSPRANS